MVKSGDRLKVGLATEDAVLKVLGKTGMKEKVSAEIIVYGKKTTINVIPDYVDKVKKEVGEIKDYADANTVNNIKQIRAEMAYAKAKGYDYKLYLNDCDKRSGPLKKAMREAGFECKEISDLLSL